jgi:hypothetical protein
MGSQLWRWLWSLIAAIPRCLTPVGPFPSELAYADECSRRPKLTDDEFIEKYYPSSDVRRDVPLRVRRVFAEQLEFDKVIPSDCPCDILQDIDLQTILDEISDEFNVALYVEQMPNDDGSFDSIVRFVNSKFA